MRTRLVEQAKGGDERAFADLVDLDGDRCYAIACRILRNVERAQDAVQQAFLLACELPRLRDPERYEVWLHRLVVNAYMIDGPMVTLTAGSSDSSSTASPIPP